MQTARTSTRNRIHRVGKGVLARITSRATYYLAISIGMVLLVMPAPVHADDEPIDSTTPVKGAAKLVPWHQSLEPALEEARRRKTKVLVRVGASWCGWCRRLDKEMDRPDVQKELAGWSLVELDADNDPQEVKRLGVGPIPALRILDASGHRSRSHDGYLPAEELIDWLQGKATMATEVAGDIPEVPELEESTLPQLISLLGHRDAGVRETAARRLGVRKGLAGAEVARVFAIGKLGARLSALDLLTIWKAPVDDLDPWSPETITPERLTRLDEWAASLPPDTESEQGPPPLSLEELTQARTDIARIANVDAVEMEAIGARLARHGNQLLPIIREQRDLAKTDPERERLDWLRYRVVASDALVLNWPGGLGKLASTDVKPRHDAAAELPEMVTSGDESLLIELFAHPDPFVRELSLRALQGVGGHRAQSELVRLLSDPEPNVRAAVLKQMSENPSAEIVPEVAAYVQRETDPDLIVHAIRLLKGVPDERAVQCLVSLFKHVSWQVRAESVEAVGELVNGDDHSDSAIPAEVVADANIAILQLIDDSDGFVVSRAIVALQGCDGQFVIKPLMQAAEKHPELAEIVATTLSNREDQESKSLLKEWLTHPLESHRIAAINAMSKTNSLEGEEFITALGDSNDKVRVAAATALLQLCEFYRTFADVSENSSVEFDLAPPEIEEPASFAQQAVKALGSLFGGKLAAEKPAEAIEIQPAVSPKSEPQNVSSSEEWLIQLRAGKGYPDWIKGAIAPLKAMAASNSTAEKIIASKALTALGQDDEALRAGLVEIARNERPLLASVSEVLRWLPWDSRVTMFNELRQLTPDIDGVIPLCQELVISHDQRADETLWDVLADPQIKASSASEICLCIQRAYGIKPIGEYPMREQPPEPPVGIDVNKIRKFAVDSDHGWQTRIALILLSQLDKPQGLECSQIVANDEARPESLRNDAFVIQMICSSPADAQAAATRALVEQNTAFAGPAITCLTFGTADLDSIAAGQVQLPRLPAEPEYVVDPSGGKRLPKELTIELVTPYLDQPDKAVAARAAYLLALLGDPSGVDRVIAYWRHPSPDAKPRSWEEAAYQSIAISNDARYVPILEEIYDSMRRERAYQIRDLYWTIRSMTGPEVLKLRKRIRDEVGMDQLR